MINNNIKNDAKPFVKWVGGKTQLISKIDSYLAQYFANKKNITYVEPFVGGGAMLFWVLKNYDNIKYAVINDVNVDLINVYKVVKQYPKMLIELLADLESLFLSLDMKDRKEYFLNQRTRYNTIATDSIERAGLFIFLNRTCFNGLYRVNSKGLYNVPFGSYMNPKICDSQTIFADSEILQRVEILSGDFEKTLDFADGNSFYYLDPPYKPISKTSSFTSYTKEDFNDEDQIRLGGFCHKINKLGNMFLLSNSDLKNINPNDCFFDNLYDSFDIKRIEATRMINSNAGKRGKISEILVTNQYQINNDRTI